MSKIINLHIYFYILRLVNMIVLLKFAMEQVLKQLLLFDVGVRSTNSKKQKLDSESDGIESEQKKKQ